MSERPKVHQPDNKFWIIDVEKRSHQKVEFKNTTVTLKAAQTIELKNKFN